MSGIARRVLSLLSALALLAGLFLGAPAPVQATPQTYYVGHQFNEYVPGSECANPDYWTDGDWTGGGAYNSDNDAIQDAADNAASGSIIYLCTGTYNFAEVVTIGAGKSIAFRGEGDETVLDGNDVTRIFNASPVNEVDQGGVLSLRDLLIMDAEVTEWNAGAIVADGLSLDGVTITRSYGAYNGGALYAEGDVTIVDSTFTDNIANADGGVLYAWNGDRSVTVRNSMFEDNHAENAGGAILATSLTITGSTFTNNYTNNRGGAVSASTVNVSHSAFEGNHADEAGAIYANDTYVIDSTFTGNSAYNDGGAIEGWSDVVISGSTFTNNTSYFGGAIASYGNSMTVTSSTFHLNSAGCTGGAIEATYAEISSSVFTQNSAGCAGGAIESYVASSFSAHDGSIIVSSSTFVENSTGGYGGAINAARTATILSSNFTSNSATILGGGIFAAYATASHSTFTSNSAIVGGAIYAAETVSVTQSAFTSNDASSFGGAIYATYATTVARSRFTGNTAGEHGGAVIVWVSISADLQNLRGNTFMRNTAPAGGAITLGPCVTPSRGQAARVESANRFSGNRATVERRTVNVERWVGDCG